MMVHVVSVLSGKYMSSVCLYQTLCNSYKDCNIVYEESVLLLQILFL